MNTTNLMKGVLAGAAALAMCGGAIAQSSTSSSANTQKGGMAHIDSSKGNDGASKPAPGADSAMNNGTTSGTTSSMGASGTSGSTAGTTGRSSTDTTMSSGSSTGSDMSTGDTTDKKSTKRSGKRAARSDRG